MRTKLISLNFIPVKNFAIHNSSMLNFIFKYKKERKREARNFHLQNIVVTMSITKSLQKPYSKDKQVTVILPTMHWHEPCWFLSSDLWDITGAKMWDT